MVAAADASPDDAEPVSSSSCTAVAIMGTLEDKPRHFWNQKQLDICVLIINSAGDEVE